MRISVHIRLLGSFVSPTTLLDQWTPNDHKNGNQGEHHSAQGGIEYVGLATCFSANQKNMDDLEIEAQFDTWRRNRETVQFVYYKSRSPYKMSTRLTPTWNNTTLAKAVESDDMVRKKSYRKHIG